jgi:hypothetical protein
MGKTQEEIQQELFALLSIEYVYGENLETSVARRNGGGVPAENINLCMLL